MRVLIFFILCACFLIVSSAGAGQPIAGRVISVNRTSNTIIITRSSSGNMMNPFLALPGATLKTQSSPPSNITVTVDGNKIPSEIRAGMHIRLWGTFNAEKSIFQADKLNGGHRRRGGKDATGVRRRLCIGCGTGYSCDMGAMPSNGKGMRKGVRGCCGH